VALLALALAAPAGAAAQSRTVRGVVVEAGTGRAVAGAEVGVIDSRRVVAVAAADAAGAFQLTMPAGRYRLRVRAPGYRPASMTVDAATPERLTVTLERAALALDAIVVTAARRPQRLADAPVATELIDRREIAASGAADLAQVLLDHTGVQVQGGIVTGNGVLLDGLGDERILVLLDGEPLVGRIGGQLDLSRVPVSGVEQVEIVRGPQSTLYGSDAMGGVINVITRPPPRGRVAAEAGLLAGTQGRREGTVRLGLGRSPVRLAMDLGRRDAAVVAGRADSADATSGSWDALLKTEIAAGSWTLLASAQLVDERQRWRSGQLWFINDNLQRSARAGARWSGGPHRLGLTAYGTEFRHHARRSTIPEPPDSIGERETQALEKLEVLYGAAAGRHLVDAGADLTRERITSDRVAGERRTQLAAEPFGQYTVTLGSWSVVAGARASLSDRWGEAVTPRLAARWRPVPALALRAGIGTGYRAPDFKELDIEFLNVGPGFGYVVRGNPNLAPEHSRHASLDLEVAPGPWYARIRTFGTWFSDFIETVALPDSGGLQVFSYQNRSAGRTAGVEAEAAVVRGGLRVEAGYAWLHSRDDETGGPLLGRALHSARGGVSWTTGAGLSTRVGAVYTGTAPLERTEDGSTVDRSGFLRVDLRAGWAAPWGVGISAGVDNVFAARPSGWSGFTGRRMYAGATWNLGAP
jgi:outer membrane receptor for ferrienterochelin and colicins